MSTNPLLRINTEHGLSYSRIEINTVMIIVLMFDSEGLALDLRALNWI